MKLTGSEYPVTHDEIRAVLGSMERAAASITEGHSNLLRHDLPEEVNDLLKQASRAVHEWIASRFPAQYYDA